jgi:GrpB-like predicted nucleotidyltransferase (UPF0157 family)
MANDVIEIVAYNPEWPQIYEREAAAIKKILGEACLAIHHFGSTSVPGLGAKAKIDILAVVTSFNAVDIPAVEQIGFEYRGEVIATGRYFAKKQPRIHLHLFEQDNPLIERNLLFRDWLRTHPADREAYAALKQQLAMQHTDGMEYCNAKTTFINTIIDKALGLK